MHEIALLQAEIGYTHDLSLGTVGYLKDWLSSQHALYPILKQWILS